jgi:hypothetical protein
MGNPDTESPSEGTRPGVFKYLNEMAEPSLFRNGKVLTRRDKDGGDAGHVGVNRKSYTLDVHDARSLPREVKMTCETNGFELG